MAWKRIPAPKNSKMSYSVNSSGTVRSTSKRTGKSKTLKNYKRNGYNSVSVADGSGGKTATYTHRAQTGAKGFNRTVDHVDGNKDNSKRSNLKIVSRVANGRKGGLKSARQRKG